MSSNFINDIELLNNLSSNKIAKRSNQFYENCSRAYAFVHNRLVVHIKTNCVIEIYNNLYIILFVSHGLEQSSGCHVNS